MERKTGAEPCQNVDVHDDVSWYWKLELRCEWAKLLTGRVLLLSLNGCVVGWGTCKFFNISGDTAPGGPNEAWLRLGPAITSDKVKDLPAGAKCLY